MGVFGGRGGGGLGGADDVGGGLAAGVTLLAEHPHGVEGAGEEEADGETDPGGEGDAATLVEEHGLEAEGGDVEDGGEECAFELDEGGVAHEGEVGVGAVAFALTAARHVVGDPVETVVDGDIGDEVDEEGESGDDEFFGVDLFAEEREVVFTDPADKSGERAGGLEGVHDTHCDGQHDDTRCEDVHVDVDNAVVVPLRQAAHGASLARSMGVGSDQSTRTGARPTLKYVNPASFIDGRR